MQQRASKLISGAPDAAGVAPSTSGELQAQQGIPGASGVLHAQQGGSRHIRGAPGTAGGLKAHHGSSRHSVSFMAAGIAALKEVCSRLTQ